jgi:hypothetical protein
MILAGRMESGYVETAVPVNGRIGPSKRLGNRRSTKAAFDLVVQLGVPSRPSPARVIFPVAALVPGHNPSVVRGCGLRDRSPAQLGKIDSIATLMF